MTLSSSVQFSHNRFIRSVIPTVAIGVTVAFLAGVQGQCVLNETQRLTAPDAIPFADFGWSVAVDGPVMAIGAPLAEQQFTFNGAVYIYRFVGGVWNWEKTLIAPGVQFGDSFGTSVGISGNDVVVGAPLAAGKGEVYVFQYNPAAATWDDGRILLTDFNDVQSNDRFEIIRDSYQFSPYFLPQNHLAYTNHSYPAALDVILTGAVNDPNTGWGVAGSVDPSLVVPDGAGGWRILIGQFAVSEGKTFTAAVRIAGDGVDTYATITSDSITGNP